MVGQCVYSHARHPHSTHTRICIHIPYCKCVLDITEHQKSANPTHAETGTDNTNPETSQILKQLRLLPSTSHISKTSIEQVDNMRPAPAPEPETPEKETEEKKEENGNIDDSAFLPSERPVQKNKKKCWVCKTKLELAQRELGGCKCGKCVLCVCVYVRIYVCLF